MKKTILGLDLGTNSIGWAVVRKEFKHEKEKTIDIYEGELVDLGIRIIPMDQAMLSDFDKGISKSSTAERTSFRGVRRLNQRHLLRRERLLRILNMIGLLPEHYANAIDFDIHLGQFKADNETNIAYQEIENGKFEFIFKESFLEMAEEFKAVHPILFKNDNKIPYDWTIYYLRKKALTEKISKFELAWLLLNFNQKRGYYQLRGEDEEAVLNKTEEYHALQVISVTAREKGKGDEDIWYDVVLENGWVYKRSSKTPLDWVGKIKDFIVTTDLTDDGNVKVDKDGKEKRSFRAPSENDWSLVKKKTEQQINASKKTVGEYIYQNMLDHPFQKINGKLVRTIERNYYKTELEEILKCQIPLHPELNDRQLYTQCIEHLYPNNDAHKNNIQNRDFGYLIQDDILFYQRPLKSKKSEISNCELETRQYVLDGELKVQSLKCIPKSHPDFQEFRLWQFLANIKIYKRTALINGVIKFDIDFTSDKLSTEEDIVKLFDFFNSKYDITQKQFLAFYKLKEDEYRWNYVEDKTYPCNETRSTFVLKSNKIEGMPEAFFTKEITEQLWHIVYSVTDKIEYTKAIQRFIKKHKLPNELVDAYSKMKPYNSDYGSFSHKAIKKLVPLMRIGKYWNEEQIDKDTKNRIDKIIVGEYDENIKTRVREKTKGITSIADCTGLPLWLASYIVYDRHSEAKDTKKWKTPNDIELYLKNEFRQHELRNPIVEQVITETLRVVKDIWAHHGKGTENYFDEIHIELGREMKNPADKRKAMTEKISENENTNIRIKALLEEIKNENSLVKPYSPSQQDLLKLYEEGVYNNEENKEVLLEINKIRKASKPTNAEIKKYKLWLDQGYLSPYTGVTIPISKLFSTSYQIEHIYPQSRYFDDSMQNKVICETEVNQLKDNMTAMEFIEQKGGSIVTLGNGKSVTLFTKDEYQNHINTYFKKNKTKAKNLLSVEIPESFINRQMNDSRYISKVVKNLMSRIVREDNEDSKELEATSKNVVVVTGSITSKMKQDWGMNDVWNEIITPRFERLNKLTNTNDFGQWENKQGKQVFQTNVPDAIAKGFSKKRIDHRHHGLDALIIACVSRSHINYLNNLNAKETESVGRIDLKKTLCFKDKQDDKGNYKWTFKKPWETFTQDAKASLYTTIVSFKQNTRVINKTNNKYQKWVPNQDGIMKKETVIQTKGENWAIRKPLHKETVYGKVNLIREKENTVSIASAIDNIENIVDKNLRKILQEIAKTNNNDIEAIKNHIKKNPLMINDEKITKVKVYETITATASRVALNTTFDITKIEKITDTAIQKILIAHLALPQFNNVCNDKGKEIPAYELAFSDDGLDTLNKNLLSPIPIYDFAHKPIYKVRVYEEGNRFAIGSNGNKKDKYVEGAKGTNLFFGIYKDTNGKRNYETIALNKIIERQKNLKPSLPFHNLSNNELAMTLSPNDLVYVPEENDVSNFANKTKETIQRIYKNVSFSKNDCYFIQNNVAISIVNKFEFSPLNKMEKTIEGIQIKSKCWKIIVNRIGIVIDIIK